MFVQRYVCPALWLTSVMIDQRYVCPALWLSSGMFVHSYVWPTLWLSSVMFVQRYVCTALWLSNVMFVQRYVCPALCLSSVMFVQRYDRPALCLSSVMFVQRYICREVLCFYFVVTTQPYSYITYPHTWSMEQFRSVNVELHVRSPRSLYTVNNKYRILHELWFYINSYGTSWVIVFV